MRVAILGMGAIGQRLAVAVLVQPDMMLSGVAVRSASAGVLAHPELPYYASTRTAAEALAGKGIVPRGDLTDLLASSDVIVDCGQAGTGAERAGTYRRASVRTIYCGGERRGDLGPLVSSALNYDVVQRARSVRLLSCNTTALARVAGCLRDELVAVDATILRCVPYNPRDTDATVGIVVHAGRSHHAADLESVLNGVAVNATSVSVPMNAGHVVHVRLGFRRSLSHEDIAVAFATSPRIRLYNAGETLETAAIPPSPTPVSPNGSACRYEVVVRVQPTDGATEATAWLSLDHAAITIPEAVDAIRGICGAAAADEAKSITNATLGITHDAGRAAREAVLR